MAGEHPDSIAKSLQRSRTWVYKWIERYQTRAIAASWVDDRSKRPHTSPHCTAREIEERVKLTRLSLYNRNIFYGAQAIRWTLDDEQLRPLPSLRTINRILARNQLTQRRTGRYQPSGVRYPVLPANLPNERQQADFVGPRHLRGADGVLRFYSLNVVDLATGRCAVESLFNRSAEAVFPAFWTLWGRLGLPTNLQVDNEMVFFGSRTYPRAMGPLIRLCLHLNIQLWFIPPAEPWRNGVVEHFNDHYQQKFLHRQPMHDADELRSGSLAFEHKHNQHYRYSKLGGKTPAQAFACAKRNRLRFPKTTPAPTHPLEPPHTGRYHLIRFIRSDCKLDIFGERFTVDPSLQYEYLIATVDVAAQKLKLFLDDLQVDEFPYKLR